VAFRSFSVGPEKGLRHATYDDLPNLVVIAGPNGAGKSTLLYQLSTRRGEFTEPGTRVIYLGPHRMWRTSTLSLAARPCMECSSHRQSLEMPTFPGFSQIVPPGLQMLQYIAGQARQPDTADESGFSVVVTTISSDELRWHNGIARGLVEDDSRAVG
jgi:hypothetical protein